MGGYWGVAFQGHWHWQSGRGGCHSPSCHQPQGRTRHPRSNAKSIPLQWASRGRWAEPQRCSIVISRPFRIHLKLSEISPPRRQGVRSRCHLRHYPERPWHGRAGGSAWLHTRRTGERVRWRVQRPQNRSSRGRRGCGECPATSCPQARLPHRRSKRASTGQPDGSLGLGHQSGLLPRHRPTRDSTRHSDQSMEQLAHLPVPHLGPGAQRPHGAG